MAAQPILIVEDEPILALDIECILLDGGYTVAAVAGDRREALQAAAKARIAFVDVNLRDGPTGPGIARELAEAHGVRVVYVTANPDQIARRAPGAIGVVAKPFRERTILVAAAVASGRCDPAAVGGDPGIMLFGGAGD